MVCHLNSCLLVLIEGWISLICNKMSFETWFVSLYSLSNTNKEQLTTYLESAVGLASLGSWPYIVCHVNFLLSILTWYVTNEFWNLARAQQSSSSSTVIFTYVTIRKQIFGQPQILSKKETELWRSMTSQIVPVLLCTKVLSLFWRSTTKTTNLSTKWQRPSLQGLTLQNLNSTCSQFEDWPSKEPQRG